MSGIEVVVNDVQEVRLQKLAFAAAGTLQGWGVSQDPEQGWGTNTAPVWG